jgi:hypothetical protein
MVIGAVFLLALVVVVVTTMSLKDTLIHEESIQLGGKFKDLQKMPRKNLSGVADLSAFQDDAGCQT